MKTAREIYNRSLALLGQTHGENTDAMEARAPALVNLLMAQLSPLDRELRGEVPAKDGPLLQIGTLEDSVGMEDDILLSLFPLGLAALLIQEEEPDRSRFFWQLYLEERAELYARNRRGRRHPIKRSF